VKVVVDDVHLKEQGCGDDGDGDSNGDDAMAVMQWR
jgi:hypothetical protein